MQSLNQCLKIQKVFVWMLLFIPLSIFLVLLTTNNTLIFFTSVLAIIPLARIIGYATKEIVLQTNPTIGSLVLATFGNIIELTIAIYALKHGLIQVVQAALVGSIIGNILLLTGLSIFCGGLKYKNQHFNKEAIGVSSTMLIIAVVGLLIPSMYAFAHPNIKNIPLLSDAVAIVMAIIYIAGLLFSLHTHKDLFDPADEIKATAQVPTMTIRTAAIFLLLAMLAAAIESEFLVKNIEDVSLRLGLAQVFIGVVIIAIITNVAEMASAVDYALDNKLDISLEIGMSSAIQIALFVVPILVLVSQIFHFGFTLVFPMFDVMAIVFAVSIINHLAADGICNWLEGGQLIAVYLIIAIAFFFLV